MRKVVTFFGCLVVLALVNCGHDDIGESCSHEGQVDDCVDGAVCAKNKGGELICEKRCNSFSDCSSTQECNTVGYSDLKGCYDL